VNEGVILIGESSIDNQRESPIVSASYAPFDILRRADP
jgi:hypothetical protein